MNWGVMDVIGKPITPYVVLRRVQSVVEQFQGRQRLRNVVQLQKADLLAQAQQIIELNRGMIEALAAAIEFRSESRGTMSAASTISPSTCWPTRPWAGV